MVTTTRQMQRHKNQGYSLIELSIVLMLVGALAAMSWTAGSQILESTRRTQTNNKLDVIESALMAFRTTNNRLPCPTDATLLPTNANYGIEAANPGSCTGAIPAANQTDATNNVVEGAVPFRALNLPAEFMYDGWGRKFVYAVNYNMTGTLSMLGDSMNDAGKIAILDASGNVRDNLVYSTVPSTVYTAPTAIYALTSYGPDGHGGYLKTGVRYSSGSTDASELANCHCNAAAAETAYSASYVQKDTTSTFGDIVRYQDRWQMATFDDTNTGNVSNTPGVVSPSGKGSVATLGARIDGVNAGDESGYSVAVGDVNGDGIPDIVIAAYNASNNGNGNSGSVYVVFGTKYGFPNPLPLSSLNGTNGFRLDGASASDRAGYSVAVGDINYDGIADIIIGAPNASYNGNGISGSVYVVFGGPTMKNGTAWSTCPCILTSGGAVINATNGYRLDGTAANDFTGNAVAVGDVNGDSYTDIIIGATNAGYNSNVNSGSVYVVYGGATMKSGAAWAANQQLTPKWLSNNVCGFGVTTCASPAVNGFRLDGATTNEQAGASVATGDINGDGHADVIIGAWPAGYNGNAGSGSVYVVYGGATMIDSTTWATTNLLTSGSKPINAIDGFRLDGATPGESAGYSVASGDINRDGKADIIIGAYRAGYHGAFSGSVYVVYGGPSGQMIDGTVWAANQMLTSGSKPINATDGFRLDGATPGYTIGTAVATGDINGDGYTDIIIGAFQASYNGIFDSGSTYVVFSGANGKMWDGTAWAATNPLTSGIAPINGTDGFRLDGVTASDWSGYSVATGDVNGDGTADIIIGAYIASYSAANSGSTYVAYGRPANAVWPATSLLSTLK